MDNIEPPPSLATVAAFVDEKVYLLGLEPSQLLRRDSGDLITAQILTVIPTQQTLE